MTIHDNESGFRLSPQQRLNWLKKTPKSTITLNIKGDINREKFNELLVNLVKFHDVLRLELLTSSNINIPLQYIANEASAREKVYFLDDSLNSESLKKERENIHTEAHQTGIDVHWETLADDHHQVSLSVPALIADRGTLLKLVGALAHQNTDANIDEEAMDYLQYAAWLYELQDDEEAEEGHNYWEQLTQTANQDAIINNELLYKEPSRSTADDAYRSIYLNDQQGINAALEEFCKQNDCSDSEVLLTTWSILLQRLHRGPDTENPHIMLNWLHDCREDYDELDTCWGLFNKALPLRCDASMDSSFISTLKHLQDQQALASEWQEYYAIESEHADNGINAYGFEYGGELGLYSNNNTDLSITITGLHTPTPLFELLLIPEVWYTDNGEKTYRFTLQYNHHYYSENSSQVLLEQFQSLLGHVLAQPSAPLHSHALQSACFETQLAQLNTTKTLPTLSSQALFPNAFSDAAKKYKQHIALCGTDHNGQFFQLSYEAVEQQSNRLAHHLVSMGVKAESRVALYLERSVDWCIAMLAVLKSGGAFVPLDTQHPKARILTSLKSAHPELILSSHVVETNTLQAQSDNHIPIVNIEDIPSSTLSSLPPNVPIKAHHAAYVLFTSGSTGTPKGVIIEHQQIHHYTQSIVDRLSLTSGDKTALVTSLAADLSYTLLFSGLLSGGELHIVDRDTTMEPNRWRDYQNKHTINHLKIVPSLLDAWLNHSHPADMLPSDTLLLGGESCPSTLLHTLHNLSENLTVYNHYGPTETTVGVLMHKTNRQNDYRQLPLSDRLNTVNTYLIRDDQTLVTNAGELAELYIAGGQLARGYLDDTQTQTRFLTLNLNPDTENATDTERVYKTGDLARYRPDGAIEIAGRADRQVKIRGFRIELDEIQQLLNRFSTVRQAAVEYMTQEQSGLRIFAFITLTAEADTSIAQLQAQLKDQLPDFMIPTLRIVESLPLMLNGKLDRKLLQQWTEKLLSQRSIEPPRTSLEELLVELWADALGVEELGINEDFFQLGGHSLAAVKLASKLQLALGADVTVNAIFAAPTAARFAQLAQEEMQAPSLVDISAMTDHKGYQQKQQHPLFCFHPSTGHVHDYRQVAEQFPNWQFSGLQAASLLSRDLSNEESLIATLAADYITHMRQQQPQGPYYLLGWSLGGVIAYSIAAQLEKAGEEIAFLGIVDSRINLETSENDIHELLETIIEELDDESRERVVPLLQENRQALVAQLTELEPKHWLSALADWAKQHGLHISDEHWEIRLRYHEHTIALLSSFTPTPLNCPLTTWWASESVDDKGNGTVDWQAVSQSRVEQNIIDAEHMTILKNDQWMQQLNDSLNRSIKTPKTDTVKKAEPV